MLREGYTYICIFGQQGILVTPAINVIWRPGHVNTDLESSWSLNLCSLHRHITNLTVGNRFVKASHCLFEDSGVGFALITPSLKLILKVKIDSIQVMLLSKVNLFLDPEFSKCCVQKLFFGIICNEDN